MPNSPFIYSGNFAKSLKPQVNLNDTVYMLQGTADPTSSAQNAPQGSIYLRTGGSGGTLYTKQDAGSSTNWTALGSSTAYVPALFQDQQTTGTNGGSSINGTQTRVLNTFVNSATSTWGASLSSNQVTLPAGSYSFWGRAPALFVNSHQVQLYNVTDAAVVAYGGSSYTAFVGTQAFVTDSTMAGTMVIAGTKVFEVRHFTGAAQSGAGLGLGGCPIEVFAELIVWKIS